MLLISRQFNSGWPIEVTTSFADSVLNNTSPAGLKSLLTPASASAAENALTQFIGSIATDEAHLDGLSSLSSGLATRDENSTTSRPTYMAAVSPWFFTHYGPDSFNKNVRTISCIPKLLFIHQTNHSLSTWQTNISIRGAGNPSSTREIRSI